MDESLNNEDTNASLNTLTESGGDDMFLEARRDSSGSMSYLRTMRNLQIQNRENKLLQRRSSSRGGGSFRLTTRRGGPPARRYASERTPLTVSS